MRTGADPTEPEFDLSMWPVDRLQASTADADRRQLEAVRIVAQQHASYDFGQEQEVRRQWAQWSLLANRRLRGDGPGDPSRGLPQDFMLRMWVIDHLGPDEEDPDWSPEQLASDTLDALALTAPQARALSCGWRELPIGQIRELRRCKNLTAHLGRLIGRLQPHPTQEQLLLWVEIRRLLP